MPRLVPGFLNQCNCDVQPAVLSRAMPAPEQSPLPELADSEPIPEAVASGSDDWEIDSSQLRFVRKVTTGSSGDL